MVNKSPNIYLLDLTNRARLAIIIGRKSGAKIVMVARGVGKPYKSFSDLLISNWILVIFHLAEFIELRKN